MSKQENINLEQKNTKYRMLKHVILILCIFFSEAYEYKQR